MVNQMQNYNLLNSFFILLSISIALAVPFTAFWLWATRRGWASIRLLAGCSGIFVLCVGFILWSQVRENWLLIGTLICAVISFLMVLTWPITAPRVVKSMKLKW
jgi:hypothetical protein